MKNILFQIPIILLFLFVKIEASNAQIPVPTLQNNPWKEDQLIMPETLAGMISKKDKVKIYNIGSVQDIKGATNMGAASESENLKRFKKVLKTLPKDEAIVIYCGCCPMHKCPNIRPAFKMAQEAKFTNVRLLNVPTNIKTDWIDKGYPVQ